jgi:hypothetical protein
LGFEIGSELFFVKTWEELLLGFWFLLDPGTKIKLIGVHDVFFIESFIQGIVGGERLVFGRRFDVLFDFEFLFFLFCFNLALRKGLILRVLERLKVVGRVYLL